MRISLIRDVFSDTYTLGWMLVNGKHLGYTCEDTDRKMEEGNDKVYGRTCIPRGTYKVVISFSHRFQKHMPEILDVPGFSGIRIHGGNSHVDTLGCPLLGSVRNVDIGRVEKCKSVNDQLIHMIELAEEVGETVWIEVE